MIYLDADGLLLDWQGYVIKTHFPTMTIEELFGMGSVTRSFKLEQMYLDDPQLFYKLKPIPGAVEFLEYINGTGECWGILTSAGSDHPDLELAKTCKVLSLANVFGIPENRITVTLSSGDKKRHCQPGDILVDDYSNNIIDWESVGGTGILVGKHIDWEQTMALVDQAIDESYR